MASWQTEANELGEANAILKGQKQQLESEVEMLMKEVAGMFMLLLLELKYKILFPLLNDMQNKLISFDRAER